MLSPIHVLKAIWRKEVRKEVPPTNRSAGTTDTFAIAIGTKSDWSEFGHYSSYNHETQRIWLKNVNVRGACSC